MKTPFEVRFQGNFHNLDVPVATGASQTFVLAWLQVEGDIDYDEEVHIRDSCQNRLVYPVSTSLLQAL